MSKIENVCLYRTEEGKLYNTKEEAEQAVLNSLMNDKIKFLLLKIINEVVLEPDKVFNSLDKYFNKENNFFIINKQSYSVENFILVFLREIINKNFNVFLKDINTKDFLYDFYKELDSIFNETKLKETDE